MTTVEAIKAAITELSSEQLTEIRLWLAEQLEQAWDAQIEKDAKAGKLDKLVNRVIDQHRTGQTSPL